VRAGRPSFTAAFVATARAAAGIDPIDRRLLGLPGVLLARAASTRGLGAVVNAFALGLFDHLELRTRAIDAAVRDAVRSGIDQLVLLGAGQDARAWRMPELAGAFVFEVDHPSSQARKRAFMGPRAARARAVTFVPVDFERDSLSDALERAGHRAGAPTMWIWEGVTPYLDPAAVRATLDAVAARSAPGSRLAVTYVTPRGLRRGSSLLVPVRAAFVAFGEPLRAGFTRAEMASELARVELAVAADTSSYEWAAADARGGRRLLLLEERLALAVSGGPPPAARAG
jgi:methyltransferase (TIGR00027 family)